jgi:hypothetical protein
MHAPDLLPTLPVTLAEHTLVSPIPLEAPPAALLTLLHESLAAPFVKVAGELARRRETAAEQAGSSRWTLRDAWTLRLDEPFAGSAVPADAVVWVQAEGLTARALGRGDLTVTLHTRTGKTPVRLAAVGQALRSSVGAVARLVTAAGGPIEVELASPFDTRGRPFELESACRAAVLSLLRRAVDESAGGDVIDDLKTWAESEAERIARPLRDAALTTTSALVAEGGRSRASRSNGHRFSTKGFVGKIRLEHVGEGDAALGLAALAVAGGRLRKLGLGDVRLWRAGERVWPPARTTAVQVAPVGVTVASGKNQQDGANDAPLAVTTAR